MADQPKKRSESDPVNTTDQSDRASLSRDLDDTLSGEQTPIKSGVDLLATSENNQFLGVSGESQILDSDESDGASDKIDSTYSEASELDFHNGLDDQNSESLGHGDQKSAEFDPVKLDTESGVDLLAASTYPDGSMRLGPEDSADLFDSLVSDARSDSNTGEIASEDRDDDYDYIPEGELSAEQSPDPADESQAEIVRDNRANQLDDDFFDKLGDDEIIVNLDVAQDKNSERDDESSDIPSEGVAAGSEDMENIGDNKFESSPSTVDRTPQAEWMDDKGENVDSTEAQIESGIDGDSTDIGPEFSRGSNSAVAQAYGWAEVDELEDNYGPGDVSEEIQDNPIETGGSGNSALEDNERASGLRQSQSGTSTAQASVLTYDNMLEEDEQMRWFTIGIPIILVAIIIIMGGYVYSLQSQIDEIHSLMSAEEDDFFAEDGDDSVAQVDDSTLAHVNSRIDNLAASVEAIANRSESSGSQISGEASPKNELANVNKDLAILAERLSNVEQKLSLLKSAPQPAIKAKSRTKTQTKPVKPAIAVDKTKSSSSAAGKTGTWSVNLMSVTEKSDADKQLKGFRQKGVAAEIQPKMISGKQWYRVQVTGFESKKEAREYAAQVKNKLGLASVWVTR